MLSDIITSTQSEKNIPIDLVGMEKVEIPAKINGYFLPAMHDIFVNLIDKNAKGIHMSRIFLITKNELEKNELSFKTLSKITQDFLDSQDGKSSNAEIKSSFMYIKKYPSLKSNNIGWRYYPVSFQAKRNKSQEFFELSLEITYSSTCPCSAGLSRQKSQEKFAAQFPQETIRTEDVFEWLGTENAHPATPHSQRSKAFITIFSDSLKKIPEISDLIEMTEESIQTPVQSVVKREDEQAFAERNGQNLLFSEDAVRRISDTLTQKNLRNFSIKVEHQESLHPHNAVATIIQNKHS